MAAPKHSCSCGDKLLSVKQVGSIASTVRKPQPAQWLIATDGLHLHHRSNNLLRLDEVLLLIEPVVCRELSLNVGAKF